MPSSRWKKNWRGPLIDNGAVEATLLEWRRLEERAPRLRSQWRWQMPVARELRRAYVRLLLIHESQLEAEANRILEQAATRGAGPSMTSAMDVLNRAIGQQAGPELRAAIMDLCEKLFHSIGLQTSVDKYYASGAERGAVLDQRRRQPVPEQR